MPVTPKIPITSSFITHSFPPIIYLSPLSSTSHLSNTHKRYHRIRFRFSQSTRKFIQFSHNLFSSTVGFEHLMARERESSQENDGQGLRGEEEELIQDMMFQKRRCCFCIPTFKSDRSSTTGSPWWGRIRATENEERWWSKGWMKVREWSELMAGPKWKTFIRRFNRRGGGGGGGCGGKQGKFHYDPLSYALNFDQGPGHDGEPDEDLVFRDFSSRYASIPISAKSSMDLGKDGPSFI